MLLLIMIVHGNISMKENIIYNGVKEMTVYWYTSVKVTVREKACGKIIRKKMRSIILFKVDDGLIT
jgi:hypothetical protein